MPIITTKTLYQFDELSDNAKLKTIESVRNNPHYLDHEWYDYAIDDFKTMLESIGFYNVEIRFTGFGSQGDGAHFTGSYQYKNGSLAKVKKEYPAYTALHDLAKALQDLESKDFYAIRFKITHQGHYSHAYCTSFDFEDNREIYGYTRKGFNEDGYTEACRSFMQEIHNSLEKEYNWYREEDQIIEHIQANELLFNVDGTPE